MQKELNEEYELIAKNCPVCDAIIQAKITRIEKNNEWNCIYRCSKCDWHHP